MFSKWFKRKSTPTNDGDSVPEVGQFRYVKAFELELVNMENAPVYTLTKQLTVGREIGNIVIADSSLSPRHATFLLQEDVVSLLDHGSLSGTSVNGKKIAPGKYVILEEMDMIQIGDLEIRLKVSTKEIPIEDVPVPPPTPHAEEEAPVELEDTVEEDVEEEKPPVKIPQKVSPPVKRPVKKKKVASYKGSSYAANALIRVLAFVSDLLLAYALLVILMPFDEFRLFLESIPESFLSLTDLDLTSLWQMYKKELGAIGDVMEDVFQFVTSLFQFLPLLLMYMFTRLLTTLIFGVSLSQLLLGIRSTGNGIWARLGGVLREVIGFITAPFLIFDIPAIISRRTLKELLTFTRIEAPSKFITILGIILYLPSLVAFTLVSPLFAGFEPPEAILISDKIDQRVKVKVPESEGTAEVPAAQDASNTLGLSLAYNPSELTIIPSFSFKGSDKKTSVKKSLLFYQEDLQRTVNFELMKTFDLKQLLGIGMKGNVFLFNKYPEIYNYAYEAEGNAAFKRKKTPKSEAAFANEVMTFMKTAFSLDASNAFELMQEQSPLIKGFIDFRQSFLSLIEYKDFSEIGFIKIGNGHFIKVSYSNKQKPFDLLIPLIRGEGRVYKVTLDKRENQKAVETKFYKFNLEKADWFADSKKSGSEEIKALQVYDLVTAENLQILLQSPDKAQSLYGYYYETSASLLKEGDPVELEIWRSKVGTFLKLLESLPPQSVQEGLDDIQTKLLQNFRDLLDALENNNFEYFGLTNTETV